MNIDLKGTYDPEDPGTRLQYYWVCPQYISSQSYCPAPSSNLQQVSFSTEARIGYQWKYNENNTVQVLIKNPKSKKEQVCNITFKLIKPNVTSNVGSCPYFDYAFSNSKIITKNLSDDAYLMTLTNNLSDISISYPLIRTNCGSSKFNITYLDLQIQDESNSIFDYTPLMQTFNLSSSSGKYSPLKISGARLQLLNQSTDYLLTTYLYYLNQTNTTYSIGYYSKPLILRRQKYESYLIAQFIQTYFALSSLSSETITLDASLSRDYENLVNRNFSYRWQCSDLVPPQMCPSQNQSQIRLTSQNRTKFNISIPGRLYEFRVQIYDKARFSSWAVAQIFIVPDKSPTKECLIIESQDKNLTTSLASAFSLPLFKFMNITSYCPEISYESAGYSFQLIGPGENDLMQNSLYNDMRVLMKNPAKQSYALLSYPKDQAPDSLKSYLISYKISYSILNAYQDIAEYRYQLKIEKDNFNPQLIKGTNQYYLSSPSIIGMDSSNITFEVRSLRQRKETLQWKCDSSLKIDKLCSQVQSNQLIIQIGDINRTTLVDVVNQGTPMLIEVQIQNNSFIKLSKYFFIVSTQSDLLSSLSTCSIRHTQDLWPYLDIQKALIASLNCEQSLDKSQFQSITWSLQTNESSLILQNFDFTLKNSQIEPLTVVRLLPYTLEQGKHYSLSLTLITAVTKETVKFAVNLNTSIGMPFPMNTLKKGQFQILSSSQMTQRIGYFYETYFQVNLSPQWQALFASNQTLNIFYSVRIFDGNYWFTIIPLTLNSSYMPSQYSFSISFPRYQNIIVDVRNNVGALISSEERNLEIYVNQEKSDSDYLALKRSALRTSVQNPQFAVTMINELQQYRILVVKLADTDYQGIKQELSLNLDIVCLRMNEINRVFKDEIINKVQLCQATSEPCVQMLQSNAYIFNEYMKLISFFGIQITKTQASYLIEIFNAFFEESQTASKILTSDINQLLSSKFENSLTLLNLWLSKLPKLTSSIAMDNYLNMKKFYQITSMPVGSRYISTSQDQTLIIEPLANAISKQVFYANTDNFEVNFPISGLLTYFEHFNDIAFIQLKAQWSTHKIRRILQSDSVEFPIVELSFIDAQNSAVKVTEVEGNYSVKFNSLTPGIVSNYTCGFRRENESNWQLHNSSDTSNLITAIKSGDDSIQCLTTQMSGYITIVQNPYSETSPDQIPQNPQIYMTNEMQIIQIVQESSQIFTLIAFIVVLSYFFIQILAIFANIKEDQQFQLQQELNSQYEILRIKENHVKTLMRLEESGKKSQDDKEMIIKPQAFALFCLTVRSLSSSLKCLTLKLKPVPILIRVQIYLAKVMFVLLLSSIYFGLLPFQQSGHYPIFSQGMLDTFIFAAIINLILYFPLKVLANLYSTLFFRQIERDSGSHDKSHCNQDTIIQINELKERENEDDLFSFGLSRTRREFNSNMRLMSQRAINEKTYQEAHQEEVKGDMRNQIMITDSKHMSQDCILASASPTRAREEEAATIIENNDADLPLKIHKQMSLHKNKKNDIIIGVNSLQLAKEASFAPDLQPKNVDQDIEKEFDDTISIHELKTPKNKLHSIKSYSRDQLTFQNKNPYEHSYLDDISIMREQPIEDRLHIQIQQNLSSQIEDLSMSGPIDRNVGQSNDQRDHQLIISTEDIRVELQNIYQTVQATTCTPLSNMQVPGQQFQQLSMHEQFINEESSSDIAREENQIKLTEDFPQNHRINMQSTYDSSFPIINGRTNIRLRAYSQNAENLLKVEKDAPNVMLTQNNEVNPIEYESIEKIKETPLFRSENEIFNDQCKDEKAKAEIKQQGLQRKDFFQRYPAFSLYAFAVFQAILLHGVILLFSIIIWKRALPSFEDNIVDPKLYFEMVWNFIYSLAYSAALSFILNCIFSTFIVSRIKVQTEQALAQLLCNQGFKLFLFGGQTAATIFMEEVNLEFQKKLYVKNYSAKPHN